MNTPRYTATVTSVTRGWTYTYTQADGEAAPAPVHLLEPLTYSWGFVDDLIPGELQAFTASFVLWCDTADDMPAVEVGDLVSFEVRLGAAGARIVAPPPMRVLAVEAEADPDPNGSVEIAVKLLDLSGDWRGKQLGEVETYTLAGGSIEQYVEQEFRVRLAELSRAIGLTIGRPTAWNGDDKLTNAGAAGGNANTMAPRTVWPADAAGCLTRVLNSHAPWGYTHTFCTIYSATADHPAGWQDPGATTPGTFGYNAAVPDTAVRIEAVSSSRKSAGNLNKLPFRLEVDSDGILTMLPTTPTDAGTAGMNLALVGLMADWVDAPARWRRAREHAVNEVNVTGVARVYDGANYSHPQYTLAWRDATDVAARGSIPRDVPTDLWMGYAGDYTAAFTAPLEPPIVAANFMADASARSAAWALDAFTLYSSRMPQEAADAILPRIAPRLPGETDGDNRIVRHVTLANVDGSIAFAGAPMRGFIAAGTLTVQDGDLVWQLRITPGDPIWQGAAPTPLTFTEWEAATAGVTYSELSDDIRMGDFAYIDA